jgi:hypothetical protein
MIPAAAIPTVITSDVPKLSPFDIPTMIVSDKPAIVPSRINNLWGGKFINYLNMIYFYFNVFFECRNII